MFGYPCPSCDQRLLASPERAGQRTICPKCLKPIVIPRPAAVPVPAAAEPRPADPPLAHDVEADNESALRADLAAQADDLLPAGGSWRAAGSATAAPVVPSGVHVGGGPPDGGSSVFTAPTPAPRPSPLAARPPAPPAAPEPARPADRRAAGMVVFDPTAVDSQDIAAELTAALTLRMKPPPEPPGDLPVSTGVWLAATAAAVTLWAYAVLYRPPLLPVVGALGVIEIILGYGWVAYHAGRRDPRRGLLALLPPAAVAKLVRPSPTLGYGPLRFVLTGAAVVGLALAGPAVGPAAQRALGLLDPPPAGPAEPPADTPLVRIAEAEQQRSMQPLVDVLGALADPAALLAPGADRPAVAAKLHALAADPRADVRTAALKAAVTWDPDADETRRAVLAALKSDRDGERRTALGLAGRWKDPAVAAAAAARLGDRTEAEDAIAALRRIGGATAEAAVLPLLGAGDLAEEANVLEVLDAVGGPKAAEAVAARAAKARGDDARRLRELAERIARRSGR